MCELLEAFVRAVLVGCSNYMFLGFGVSLATVLLIAASVWAMRNVSPAIDGQTALSRRMVDVLLALALLLLVGLRIWAVVAMNHNWFIQDDAFDACIMPFQMYHHEPIWGGGTNYLTYLIYLVAFRFCDFSVRVASAVNAVTFIVSFLLITVAVRRELGNVVALFVISICAVSYPLILHSVYATAITFAFLPLGTMLVVLSRPASFTSGVCLALSLLVSIFLYPGGTLVGICLLIAHMALMHRWWRVRALIGLGLGGVLAATCACCVRHTLSPASAMTQWAGGAVRFDDIGLSTLAVLKDTFWISSTWNTFNGNEPYFEPMWVGWLLCSLIVLLVAMARKRMGKEERWIAISWIVFMGSAALSGMTGTYPGVRRIVSAIPFLYLACGIICARFLDHWRRPWPVLAITVTCWLLLLARSVGFAASNWPLAGESTFIADSLRMLENVPTQVRKIVILSYPKDQFAGLHYRCSLGMTGIYRRRFDAPIVASRELIGNGILLGGISEPFILLSFDRLSPRSLMESVGRAPTETCVMSSLLSPDPNHLAEVHFFARKEAAPSAHDEPMTPPQRIFPPGSVAWLYEEAPDHGVRCVVFLDRTPLMSLRSLFARTPDREVSTDAIAIPETRGILATSDGTLLSAMDNVRVVFTGKWLARGLEETILRVQADDGCRAYVDGEVVIDYDGTHAFGDEVVSKPFRLSSGEHVIAVDYFEWGGNAGLGFEWKAKSGQFQQLKHGAVLP